MGQLVCGVSDIMVVWIPRVPPEFIIEVTNDFQFIRFIKEPAGNIKTFDEIVLENQQARPPPPELLTAPQVDELMRQEYADTHNIEIVGP